jgi:alginate O-acetyltransferase complex protein AlgJ
MSTDVHAGRDGWLFLIGGSNKVTTLYDRQSRLSSDAKLHHWVKLIEARARRLQGMGIQYIHLNVPEKLTIYDHQLADPPIVDWRLSPAVRLQEMLQQSPHAHVWLDLVAPLRAAREGCLVAYGLICERICIAPEPELLPAIIRITAPPWIWG